MSWHTWNLAIQSGQWFETVTPPPVLYATHGPFKLFQSNNDVVPLPQRVKPLHNMTGTHRQSVSHKVEKYCSSTRIPTNSDSVVPALQIFVSTWKYTLFSGHIHSETLRYIWGDYKWNHRLHYEALPNVLYGLDQSSPPEMWHVSPVAHRLVWIKLPYVFEENGEIS